MILVTVGTHTQGFSRLIRGMDHIADVIDEQMVMQIGPTEYLPRNATYFRFSSQVEMDRLNREAKVVVSHAGAGSILTALRWRKPVIVVPRLSKYGEHIDDHQLQLTDTLSRQRKILAVHDVKDIQSALEQVRSSDFASVVLTGHMLVHRLRRYVAAFASAYAAEKAI